MEQKQFGMIIKQINVGDMDQVVTILTRDEIIACMALGVRKITSKNRVALQLGNIVEIELFRARLQGKVSKVKRAVLIKQPPLQTLDTAEVLFEVIKSLSKMDKTSPELLDGIVSVFPSLGSEFNHHAKTFIFYRLLSVIGLKMNTNNCVECNRYDNIDGFEFYKGGFLCSLHSPKKQSLEFLKAIRKISSDFEKYKSVSPSINKNIFEEIKSFLKENTYFI